MCTYLYEFDSLESKAWISYYNETQETATESSAGGKEKFEPAIRGDRWVLRWDCTDYGLLRIISTRFVPDRSASTKSKRIARMLTRTRA